MKRTIIYLAKFFFYRLKNIGLSNSKVGFHKNINESGSKLKVHIGCGEIQLLGWVNIDARPLPHVHLVSERLDLDEFSDGSIGEIYLSHVLEHLSFEEVNKFLEKMHHKIAVGGVLRISVPDFESIVTIYLENDRSINSVKYALMGGQDYEFNFHKSVYNHKSLESLLLNAGFTDIENWNTEEAFGADIGDWSNKTFLTVGGEHQISLNLSGKKNDRQKQT